MEKIFYSYPKIFDEMIPDLLSKYRHRDFVKKNKRFIEVMYFLFDLVIKAYEHKYDNCYISKKFENEKSIQKIYPDSHRVLQKMVQEGLLKIDEPPKRHINVTGYVLGDKLLNSDVALYEVTDPKQRTKLIEMKPKYVFPDEDHFLLLKRDLLSIRIKEDEARAFVNMENEKGTLTAAMRLRCLTGISRIVNKDFFLREDDAGRIQTNVATLPKILRPFLYFEGSDQRVNEVDLSNSQPLFISLEMMRFYKQYGLKIDEQSEEAHALLIEGKFYRLVFDILDNNWTDKQNKEAIMKAYYSLSGFSSAHKFVLKSVAPEQIKFLDRFKEEFNKERRDALKTALKKYKSKLENATDQLAKEVINNNIRQINKSIFLVNKEVRSITAKIMQSIESEMFINTIVPRLYGEFPDIRICTIHDSLLVEEKYRDIVKTVIIQEFRNWYGIEPYVKIK